MEQKLGKITLNRGQIERSQSLKSQNIKGFKFDADGTVTVNVVSELSQNEATKLLNDLASLDQSEFETEKDKRLKELKSKNVLTNEEITELLKLKGIL